MVFAEVLNKWIGGIHAVPFGPGSTLYLPPRAEGCRFDPWRVRPLRHQWHPVLLL